MATRLTAILAGAAMVGVCSAARAQVLYRLEGGSTLKIEHCLGPCACPPHSETGMLGGTFTLTRGVVGPLFTDYVVSGARWTALMPNGPIQVLGEGTYRIGGEVAIMHEMSLSLVVQDSPISDPHKFNSGMVTGDPANPFPRIGITVQSEVIGCNQYTVHLVAAPAPCQADCDGSGGLNANDFQCFLNHYAAGDLYANCDGSTVAPVLNANDFQCYLNRYAAGCDR